MAEPAPDEDPELAAFQRRPIQTDDDPELVAFEHAIRKRNIIVYSIGGLVLLPIGAFFIALSSHLEVQRLFHYGLLLALSGVGFLTNGIRLAWGAPMVEDESERAQAERKRRAHTARVVVAVLSFIAAAIVIVVAMAGHPGLYPVACGLCLGGVMMTQRAYPPRQDPGDTGDADGT